MTTTNNSTMTFIDCIQDVLTTLAGLNDASRALVTLASSIGVIICLFYIVSLLFWLIRVFRLYVLSQYCCKGVNFVKKYGQWAVISGATDGIGQEMAKELAKRGMSIIVIGRSTDKLAATKSMLELVPNVGRVETVKADLSDWSPDNYDMIRDKIEPDKRDIGVLINNVGMVPDENIRLGSHERGHMQKVVNVNILAAVNLTEMILPGMKARQRGLVINVSSIAGLIAVPYYGVYAPTKAFVNSFTRQLQMEYSSHPIDIVLLEAGPVNTRMLGKITGANNISLVPPPDAYARSVINALSTGIQTFAGVMVHEFMVAPSVLLDRLGLMFTLTHQIARSTPTGSKISPVPKRKKLATGH